MQRLLHCTDNMSHCRQMVYPSIILKQSLVLVLILSLNFNIMILWPTEFHVDKCCQVTTEKRGEKEKNAKKKRSITSIRVSSADSWTRWECVHQVLSIWVRMSSGKSGRIESQKWKKQTRLRLTAKQLWCIVVWNSLRTSHCSLSSWNVACSSK